MRIVLDTNCFLAIIPKTSPFRPIFDAFRQAKFELAVSTEILNEYEEIFGQKMTPTIANNLLELLDKQPNTILTEIYYRWNLITQDFDDNKFVDCGISAGVDFIVTHDGHFNELKKLNFPKIQIITLSEFLEIVKS